MKRIATRFEGVWILEPRVFRDSRGWFLESWSRRAFADAGIEADFVQDNHSRSSRNVLRGLHFQAPPRAQSKLVRCTQGRIWDVVVDIRHGSPTYGQWEAIELDAEAHRMIFVPLGFAHGFCVLSDSAEIQYKCSDFYAPELSCGVRWDDPAIGVAWPIADPVLSEQDRRHPVLADLPAHFRYGEA
jgi:dTDP-4-dehydrorhamnose 3,5-epimerase